MYCRDFRAAVKHVKAMKDLGNYIVMKRREPQTIDKLIEECIRDMKLEVGLNDMRIFAAWDKVSGAAEYTMDKYFRNGTLCCSISSSVVRSMLTVRREQLLRQINAELRNEAGTISGRGKVLEVKRLVLR